jgi:uncharacterized protein YndB with AHSA1/START domain
MADILQEFTIKAPQKRVFETIATPKGLDRWWTQSATGEAKEKFEFGLSFGPGYDWRGKVTRYTPNSTFELLITEAHPDWVGTRVGCQLKTESPGVTRVRFYHTKWPAQNEHWRVSCYCPGHVPDTAAALPRIRRGGSLQKPPGSVMPADPRLS